jgi:hypothetical protein
MKNKMKLLLSIGLIFSLINNYTVKGEQPCSFEEPVQESSEEDSFNDSKFDESDFLDDLAEDDSVKNVRHQDQKITYNLETAQLAAAYLWHVYVVGSYASCKKWITNFLTYKTSK